VPAFAFQRGKTALQIRISIYCPYCHKYTSVDPARIEVTSPNGRPGIGPAVWRQTDESFWWMGVTNCCKQPVLVHNGGDTVYPARVPRPTDSNVPEHIRNDLDEAKRCYAVSAWRAAAVMARRALQSAVNDQGARKGSLAEQITDLADQGKITVALKEWADAVRFVGNDAAHPGGDPVAEKDAEDVVTLAEKILEELYVMPAIAARHLRKKMK